MDESRIRRGSITSRISKENLYVRKFVYVDTSVKPGGFARFLSRFSNGIVSIAGTED